MGFIKKTIATLFSTQFLLKILIIVGIIVLFTIADSGIRIHVNHYLNTPYGGLEITIKDKK